MNISRETRVKDRIKLLSLAKANANVATVGVSRQQQQQVNHEVTDLLDVANIQDDLLQRLKADDRIDPERKAEIELALTRVTSASSEALLSGLLSGLLRLLDLYSVGLSAPVAL